ncbi:cysteine synthase family protein [Halanaerobiaceae bacterium Z-7014]|uniref:cysteine synthase n=1 Tax=Halonatronomonas betaini TaxID=2778430 RepID=A0A931AQA7_9FIRM|nr:cysteine synthase family protein [Halonatronomonas betaini]MBF8437013.1 cysteine synthase family protein [Halonatronomonas betaini]
MIIHSGEDLIGNTPIVKLNNLVPAELPDFYLKLEYLNPAGSIKDRPAFEMLKSAEQSGQLPAGGGGLILEASSGNTGIGLARAAAILGHKTIIVLPEKASQERRQLMAAFGAELIISPGDQGMKGAYELCKELEEEYPNAFRPDQFGNQANPEAHRKTTGPEILEAFGQDLNLLITSCGTGGTLTGTGSYLKKKIPGLKVFTYESVCAPVLSEGKQGSHNIPGTGPGFVPDILDKSIYDRILLLDEDDVYNIQHQLAVQDGLFLGPSSAAGVVAGLTVAEEFPADAKFLIIAPDGGERYLSTLFPK